VQRFLDGDRDVEQRRRLARQHFERARADVETGDRRIVMREAAAALALDPQLAGAAALVGRLMLEPPKTTPPEVHALIRTDDERDAKTIARAGLGTAIASMFFAQLLWLIRPPGSIAPLVMTGVLGANSVLAWLVLRARRPFPGVTLVANAVIVFVLARQFSPILVAPGVAASLAMAMVLTPRFTWLGSPWSVGVLMIGAAIVPLVLESFGMVSRTMGVDALGLVFHAPALGPYERAAQVVGGLYAVCLIAGACIAGYAMRRRTQAAHRHLHLQAWQLRSLVASP
jgi:serine/threonine-protein kinase